MRLCIAVTSPQTVFAFLGQYLDYLVDDGWEVYLVTAPHEDLEAFTKRRNVTLRTIAITREPSILSDIRALAEMTRALRDIQPDVVAYATPKASLLGAIASWATRTPRRVYEQWGLRLEGQRGLRKGILYATEWIACRLSTEVVANSRSLAEILQHKKLVSSDKVVVLGEGSSHGVDIKWFHPGSLGGELDAATRRYVEGVPDTLLIGYVGRVHEDKGIDTLLKAIQLANNQGALIRALIVGPTAELGSDALMRNWRSLTESGVVHFVGPVRDTRPYYRTMDALVLMSLREGFPNVVLEAAAMAVPSIVSDATGTIDSVVDGETGIIVPTRDHVKLANVLVTLWSDNESVRKMGNIARQHVTERFESKKVMAMHSARFAGRRLDL